jgi:hypothetical protein
MMMRREGGFGKRNLTDCLSLKFLSLKFYSLSLKFTRDGSMNRPSLNIACSRRTPRRKAVTRCVPKERTLLRTTCPLMIRVREEPFWPEPFTRIEITAILRG